MNKIPVEIVKTNLINFDSEFEFKEFIQKASDYHGYVDSKETLNLKDLEKITKLVSIDKVLFDEESDIEDGWIDNIYFNISEIESIPLIKTLNLIKAWNNLEIINDKYLKISFKG